MNQSGESLTPEEEAIETHRAAFKRKRWEEEQRKKAKHERREKALHQFMWYLSMPVTAFAIMLLADGWFPTRTIQENVIEGFQQRAPRTRHGSGELKSFMRTSNHVVRVQSRDHLNFPYYATDKPSIILYETSIFGIVTKYSFTDKSAVVSEVPATVHSFPFPLKWLLLVSSLFTLIMRHHSKLTYALCFLPEVFLAMTLIIMY